MNNNIAKKLAIKKLKASDRKLVMTLAGVAVVAGSVVAVADYVRRKKHQKTAHAAELILGIAGVAAGTLLATEPRREANRITLELDDIFEGVDLEVARRQVREALNRSEAEDEAPVIVVEEVEAEVVDIAPEIDAEAVEAEIIEITPVVEEAPVAEASVEVEVEPEIEIEVEPEIEVEAEAEAETEVAAEEIASEESTEA